LLVKLSERKEKYRQWKQGDMSWEKYRDAVWTYREWIRKAKMQMELNLARDVKNNSKSFFRYIDQKRQAMESEPPLKNEKGELASTNMEKAEVHDYFFFLPKLSLTARLLISLVSLNL